MEMTDAKVVEKKIYEDGKKEYASKGLAGTAHYWIWAQVNSSRK